MKAKIDGVEIEGTCDEICDMINRLKHPKETQVKDPEPESEKIFISRKKKKTKSSGGRGVRLKRKIWTDRWEKVHKLVEKGIKVSAALRKVVPGTGKFYIDKYKRWEKNHYGDTLIKPEVPAKPNKPDKRRQRGKFICDRANYLQKQQNMSREQAYSIAAQEWNKHKKVACAPELIADEEQNKVLMDCLKMISHKDATSSFDKLTYFNCGGKLNLSLQEWFDACSKIQAKSDIISKCLGVPNKFKIIKTSTEISITYN